MVHKHTNYYQLILETINQCRKVYFNSYRKKNTIMLDITYILQELRVRSIVICSIVINTSARQFINASNYRYNSKSEIIFN